MVDARLPQLHAGGEGDAQRFPAAGFDEEARLGHHLAVARDLAGEAGEIDDLVDGLTGCVPLDIQLQRKRPRGVLVNRERG